MFRAIALRQNVLYQTPAHLKLTPVLSDDPRFLLGGEQSVRPLERTEAAGDASRHAAEAKSALADACGLGSTHEEEGRQPRQATASSDD
jgi:hypothetical protein